MQESANRVTHAASLGLTISREPPGTGPVDHIAFNANDYDRVRRQLTTRGVRSVRNRVPAAGLRQLFFDDPNGVRVEINVRDPLS